MTHVRNIDETALKPSARKVLHALRSAGAGGATTRELGQEDVGGFRFGARICELRKAGFRIREQRERKSSSRYWLLTDDEARGAA